MKSIKYKQKFYDSEPTTVNCDKIVEGGRSTPPTCRLREIGVGDASRLAGLRRRAISECAWNFGTPPAIEFGRGTPYYRRQLFSARMGGATRYLGLWQGKDLDGMAGLRLRRARGTPLGLVFSMYIAPELRGRQLGRALLRAAEERIQRLWNPPKLRMNVEIHNLPALKLYQSEGFHILRTEPAAFRIGAIDYDIHVMEKNLSQIQII